MLRLPDFLQVDKEWSAISKRPYDPFLSDHGEDQVLLLLTAHGQVCTLPSFNL